MKILRSSPISLVFIALAVSLAVGAKAAPIRARATLLSLFERSDAIMIGRFDKREDSGTNRVGSGFTQVTTKTYFDVSTVIKGEPRKFVVIEDEEFRYQVPKGADAPSDAVFSVGSDVRDLDSRPKPGDTVLLFLKNDGDSLVLADEADGVRKISASDQSIYIDRIKELDSIFGNGDADPSKVAAWLVRCAGQAATRWDGTHELMQGFRHLDWHKQPDPNGYERIDPSVSYVLGPEASNALSDDLKNALTQILISSDFRVTAKSNELADGDRELIALVKRWDPKMAAAFLLTELKSGAFTAHENAGMMFKIAELIGDSRSADIIKSYHDANSSDGGSTKTSRTILDRMVDNFVRNAETKLSQPEATQSN
jgi:hypothetical protein